MSSGFRRPRGETSIPARRARYRPRTLVRTASKVTNDMARAKVSHSWNLGLFGALERGRDQEKGATPSVAPFRLRQRGARLETHPRGEGGLPAGAQVVAVELHVVRVRDGRDVVIVLAGRCVDRDPDRHDVVERGV